MELICKMCGKIMNSLDDTGVCECENCGSRQTVPTKFSAEQTEQYNTACSRLLNNDTEGAEKMFLQLCADVPDESECYWGMVLCRCGVKYTDDPVSGMKIVSITKAYSADITSGQEFQSAIEFATNAQKEYYRREAAAIEMLRLDMIERVGTGEKYDVFICCKTLNDHGLSTPDNLIAAKIYEQLSTNDLNVFFAPETLKNISENHREPYINAASYNSENILVICTDKSFFSAVQFRKEWHRCVSAAHKNSEKKIMLCVKNIASDDIPDELSAFPVKEISNTDLLDELITFIGKREHENEHISKDPSAKTNPEKLLGRVEKFLADEDFEAAKEYSQMIIDADPGCWQAHFSNFLAENCCRNSSELMLEESINGLAADYIDGFGYDVSDEDIFREELCTIIGNSLNNAIKCAHDDEKLNLSTIFERLVSAVRDAVFMYEQEMAVTKEKQELDELRTRHIKEAKHRKAVERKRRSKLKQYTFTFTLIIVLALAFIAIYFNFKWASVSIIVVLIATAIIITELDK